MIYFTITWQTKKGKYLGIDKSVMICHGMSRPKKGNFANDDYDDDDDDTVH
jgi:hypothetical protein